MMKKLLLLGVWILVGLFVGAVGWSLGAALSTDHTGMGLGILLGIMASIPATLILRSTDRWHTPHHRPAAKPPQQPTIIVVHHTSPPLQQGASRDLPVQQWHVVEDE